MSGPGGGGRRWTLAALVRLYPGSFRERYGTEMVELAVRRVAGAGPGLARLRAWATVTWDLVRGAAAERLGRTRSPHRPGDEEPRRETTTMWKGVAQDLRYAAQRVVRAPLFSLAAVAIVALGIGANTAVFSVVDSLILRDLPFGEPERVVRIYQDSDEGDPNSSSYPAYRDMRSFDGIFEAVSASTPASVVWEAPGGPRNAVVEFASASQMGVLGLEPALGRWFDAELDHPGAGHFAVVSHHAWRTAFGGDRGIVGRTVRLNGWPVTVVGVGPEAYAGTNGAFRTDFWLSISSVEVGGSFRVANLERRQDHWYDVQARLAPGVSVEEAQGAMDALAARLAADFPELNEGRDITVFRAEDVKLRPGMDGALVATSGLLMGIAAIVLLLACSNLANLLLVKGIARSAEVAVRRALGASRVRVARLFLAEALLLSAAGGIGGVLLARWSLGFTDRLSAFLPMQATLDIRMDGSVLAFSAVLVVASAVFFGFAPALRSARSGLSGTLREDGRSASPGRATSFVQGGLVAAQVAASVVLLVGATLLVRSLAGVSSVDPGFRTEGVAYLGVGGNAPGLDRAAAAERLEAVREAVAALTGVTGAALTSRPPLAFGGSTTTVVEGYDPPSGTGAVELDYAVVTEGYFDVVAVPIRTGRGFRADDADGEPVVIVNEAAARRFWGGRDPLGGRIRPQSIADGWRRVIGVVGDHRVEGMGETPVPMLYFPAGRGTLAGGYVVAATDGDATTLLEPMRRTLASVAPTLPLEEVGTLEERVDASLAVPRLTAGVMGGFALLALLLAGVGVYAVVSFSVARRTAEMGIRMALGADRSRLVRGVVLRSLGTVAVGLVAGLGVAFLGAPLLRGVLFGVPPLDPVSFGAAAGALALLAVVAAWIPARLAAGADPLRSLRST